MSFHSDKFSLMMVDEDEDAQSYDGVTVSACEEDHHHHQVHHGHHAHEDDNDDDEVSKVIDDLLHRPIVVGYSFGPKKMSTMGVVMAEASKTGLSTDMILPPLLPLVQRVATQGSRREEVEDEHEEVIFPNSRMNPSTDLPKRFSLTSEVLSSFANEQSRDLFLTDVVELNNVNDSSRETSNITNDKSSAPSLKKSPSLDASLGSNKMESKKSFPSSVWFSTTGEHQYSTPSSPAVTASPGHQPHHTRRIVRHLNSPSPSVSSWGSTGTRTASTAASVRTISAHFPTNATTGTTADSSSFTRTSTAGSAAASAKNKPRKKAYPIRVSFVPLDPEIPLEEQHGGIDVILHKLTEDILLLSQLSLQYPMLKKSLQLSSSSLDAVLNEVDFSGSDAAAIRRVHRLSQFQKLHGCSLVDDPACVQTLMSRADIASVLKNCLSGVTSLSGTPVHSPKYAVITPERRAPSTEANSVGYEISKQASKDDIFNAVQEAQLSFPLIVKPLTAAGTKASHSMAVVTHPSGLEDIADRVPCLLQEYANHNALLYKVYVLGDFVSVYKRRSLPNLPPSTTTPRKDAPVVIEFDSQRPYPRLKDFGFNHADENSGHGPVCKQTPFGRKLSHAVLQSRGTDALASSPSTGNNGTKKALEVTPEEVQPIVEALKKAFGLEIFGFDVLIKAPNVDKNSNDTNGEDGKPTMLVVDVNYFPSYKEVPDFPALLAKFLTGRAIQGRLERLMGTTTKH
ncbi:hypothetical protein ACA910_021943 [Epithemia clementina (nom. ined.)]